MLLTDQEKLQQEYDQLLGEVLHQGAFLTGQHSQLLPRSTWSEMFGKYQQDLQHLRELGNKLCPVPIHATRAVTTGDALVSEVLALFAEK